MADSLDALLKMKLFYEDAKRNIYKKFHFGTMQGHKNRVPHDTMDQKVRHKFNSKSKNPDIPSSNGGFCEHRQKKDKADEKEAENREENGNVNEEDVQGNELENLVQDESICNNNAPTFESECNSIDWKDAELRKIGKNVSKHDICNNKTDSNCDRNLSKNLSSKQKELSSGEKHSYNKKGGSNSKIVKTKSKIDQKAKFGRKISKSLSNNRNTTLKVNEKDGVNVKKVSGSKLIAGGVLQNKNNMKRPATTQEVCITKAKKGKVPSKTQCLIHDSCVFSDCFKDNQMVDDNSSFTDFQTEDDFTDDGIRWIYPPQSGKQNRIEAHKRINVCPIAANFSKKKSKKLIAMLDIRTTIDPFFFNPTTSNSFDLSGRKFLFDKKYLKGKDSNARMKMTKPMSSSANVLRSNSAHTGKLNISKRAEVDKLSKTQLVVTRARQAKKKAKLGNSKSKN